MLNNSRANTKAKTKVAYKVSTSSSAISIQRDKVHISQKNEKMIKLVVKLKIKRKGIHSEGERKKIETNGTDTIIKILENGGIEKARSNME